MSQIRNLLLGAAVIAVTTNAFAQNAQPSAPGVDASGQMSAQAAPVTPAPQNMVAPGSTDPLVQKRVANAQANAEYRASKKASKEDLKASNKQAKEQYKEQVRNAKINQKADKQAAKDELNATAEPTTTKDSGLQH
jgi:hypothetical protein